MIFSQIEIEIFAKRATKSMLGSKDLIYFNLHHCNSNPLFKLPGRLVLPLVQRHCLCVGLQRLGAAVPDPRRACFRTGLHSQRHPNGPHR